MIEIPDRPIILTPDEAQARAIIQSACASGSITHTDLRFLYGVNRLSLSQVSPYESHTVRRWGVGEALIGYGGGNSVVRVVKGKASVPSVPPARSRERGTKPWLLLGISRRTWYRRQHGTVSHDTSSSV